MAETMRQPLPEGVFDSLIATSFGWPYRDPEGIIWFQPHPMIFVGTPDIRRLFPPHMSWGTMGWPARRIHGVLGGVEANWL